VVFENVIIYTLRSSACSDTALVRALKRHGNLMSYFNYILSSEKLLDSSHISQKKGFIVTPVAFTAKLILYYYKESEYKCY
jgi:hypothetical protein